MLEEPTSLRLEGPGVRALFSEAARFQPWLAAGRPSGTGAEIFDLAFAGGFM
jgi:hypothetical protein